MTPDRATELIMSSIKRTLKGMPPLYERPTVEVRDRKFEIYTFYVKTEYDFDVELEFRDGASGMSAGSLAIYALFKLDSGEWQYECIFESSDEDLSYLDNYVVSRNTFETFEDVLGSVQVDVRKFLVLV